ncbi:unnamed protein product [Urochloa humidicola]
MAAERTAYRDHYLSQSGKKKHYYYQKSRRQIEHENFWNGRWIRKFQCLLCLVVLWKHWKLCRALVKAYAMNPLLRLPVLFFFIPALMGFAI